MFVILHHAFNIHTAWTRCRHFSSYPLYITMVRPKFPYVHFPTTSTTGADLFPILQKVISRLTRLGIQIMTVTCDGASENRLLFSLHDEKNDKTAYKIKNVYTYKYKQKFEILQSIGIIIIEQGWLPTPADILVDIYYLYYSETCRLNNRD